MNKLISLFIQIQSRDQLLKCQVIRRRLARIVHAPFFAKTVTGCFVRVQIGSNDGKPIYRVSHNQICEHILLCVRNLDCTNYGRGGNRKNLWSGTGHWSSDEQRIQIEG